MSETALAVYLKLLDSQRQAMAFTLEGLEEAQAWQRPFAKEWCIGEILSHTVRFYHSFLPALRSYYRLVGWFGRLRRNHPYKVTIENVYQRPGFPMWTGFLWSPQHTPKKPVPLAALLGEVEAVHASLQDFYAGKDQDVLGNIYAWDPAIGVVNLVTALKVGIDHDQLHYQDVIALAEKLKENRNI